MPLPPSSAARQRIHLRQITLEGWQRDDGLLDIEARMVDSKDQDYQLISGSRKRGEPVHDIWVRVTIDDELTITAAAASIDDAPYPGTCERIAPDYQKLVGLNLMKGFRQAVVDRFRNVSGCLHLSELVFLLPTAAVQTLATHMNEAEGLIPGDKPFQLDRCHALNTESEVVRRYYPRWFRESKPAA